MAPTNLLVKYDWEDDTPVQGGWFDIVRFLRDGHGEVMAVSFRRTSKDEEVPPAMETVRDKANAAVSVIRRRFSTHVDKETWLRLIYNAARNGTLRPDAQPGTALNDLEHLEQMMIEAMRPMRSKYIAQLFGSFLLTISLTGLVHFLINQAWVSDYIQKLLGIPGLDTATWLSVVNGQIATFYGISLGILFSGIVQNRVISKNALKYFDPDGFSTPERLLYVWVAATALEVFLWFDVVTIGVGHVLFNDIQTKAWIGALIGLVTALATEAIVNLTTRTAKSVEQRES